MQWRDTVTRIRTGRHAAVARSTAWPALRGAWLVVVLAVVTPACATKRDVRVLTDQIAAMQARQDSLYRELQQQTALLLETSRSNADQLARVQGTLANQLIQVQDQIVQLQELSGLSHAEIARLREQIDMNRLALDMPVEAPGDGDPAVLLYQSGVEMLGRGNTGTARRAFERVIQEYPTHPVAADAQYQIAETYLSEQPPQRDVALQELEKVVQRYPDSPRAPSALYRAGVIAEERGETSRAMEYFNRVISAYPGSDEERLARQKLNR